MDNMYELAERILGVSDPYEIMDTETDIEDVKELLEKNPYAIIKGLVEILENF